MIQISILYSVEEVYFTSAEQGGNDMS